jgi:hypothetical protein
VEEEVEVEVDRDAVEAVRFISAEVEEGGGRRGMFKVLWYNEWGSGVAGTSSLS